MYISSMFLSTTLKSRFRLAQSNTGGVNSKAGLTCYVASITIDNVSGEIYSASMNGITKIVHIHPTI